MIRLYPWLIWFLSSGFIFYKYLLQVSPSAMVPELMREFSLNGTSMGNITAFYFYAYFLMQIPAGLMLDRFSVRRLMTIAILVCALGVYLFSIAHNLWLGYFGRVLIGIGGSFSAVGTMKLISVWFKPKQFALVSGLMMTMAMLGAVGGQGPIAYYVQHLGWRHTLLLATFLGLILAAVVFIFVRDSSKGAMHGAHSFDSLRDIRIGFANIIKKGQVWLVSIYSGLAFAPISAFAGLWGVPFIMEKYAMPREVAASLVSLVFIGFAVGSPIGGWLSDRIARRKPIMVMGTGLSLLILTVIIYSPNLSKIALTLLFLLFGFFSGFFFVSFATIREINSPKLSGSSIGFINMFNALCGALSAPLVGVLLDFETRLHHSKSSVFSLADYHFALVTMPLILLVALILQIFIKESHCRQV